MANEVTIHVKAKDTASKAVDTIGRTVVTNITKATTKMAGFTAAAVAIAPATVTVLAPVVAWTVKLGTALAGAAPLLAGFAVQGLLVKATLQQIFDEENKLVKAFRPLTKAFLDAGQAASKAAAEGIRPMVNDLIKAGLMDRVASVMKNIGVEVKKVAFGFLTWTNTKPGLAAIRGILEGTERLVRALGPAVTLLGMSFLEMAGRASDAAGKLGLEKGLAGALKKVAVMMDDVSESDMIDAFETLAAKVKEIRVFIDRMIASVIAAWDWFKKYEKQINRVADGMSVLAIAFGIFAGAPIIAVIGGLSLIIRHFDKLRPVIDKLRPVIEGVKRAFLEAGGWLDPLIDAFQRFATKVWPEVKTAFSKIKTAVMPVLREIAGKIKNDLIPALAEFVDAVAPIVAIMVRRFGPILAVVFKAVAKAASLNISYIVVLFKAMSAVLRAAMRVYETLRFTITRAMEASRKAVSSGVAKIRADFAALKARIVAIFDGARTWLSSAGRNIINGFLDAMKAPFEAVKTWVSGIAKWIKDNKGPISLDRTLLEPAGKALMEGLLSGLKFGFGSVGDFVYGAGSKISDIISKIKESTGPSGGGGIGAIGSGMSGARRAALRLGASSVFGHRETGSGRPAWDIMVPSKAVGNRIAAHLRANRGAYSLDGNIIWNMLITNAGRGWNWGRYTPIRRTGDYRHVRHVHASFDKGGWINEPVFGVGRSGKTYSFGEKESEYVTPGGKMTGGGRGSIIVNAVTNADPYRIAGEVAWVLKTGGY